MSTEEDEKPPPSPPELYDLILQQANRFMFNCKHFAMEVLRDENPSYAEVAAVMRKIALILAVVADEFDPLMGQKAFEYCDLMTRMGIAIDKGNKIELQTLVAELQRKPGV